MPDEGSLRERLSARDDALRRLRTITWAVVLVMLALAGIFAGLAAQATAARKLVRVRVQETVARAPRPRQAGVPPPPPLPAPGRGSPQSATPATTPSAPATTPSAPAAPAAPPVAAAAPAVAVSGGS
jgi:hypothetical protein